MVDVMRLLTHRGGSQSCNSDSQDNQPSPESTITAETVSDNPAPDSVASRVSSSSSSSSSSSLGEKFGAAPANYSAAVVNKPYPWILNPVIDLLFCCGGAFWILYAIFATTGREANLFGSPAAFGLMATAIIGLHLIGDSHQPATLFRVYFSPSTRKVLGKPVAIVAVFALAAGVCMVLAQWTAAFFLKVVLLWGVQHQLSQSYGIALVYCFKRNYFMSKEERRVMFAMIWAMIIYLDLRILTLKDFGSWTLNGYTVPFTAYGPEWLPRIALIGVQATVAAFAVMVVRKYMREKRIFPLPAMLTVSTLMIMPFVCGTQFWLVWYFFSSTFFHSSQYLCVTATFYFKERGLPENVPFSKIASMLMTPVFAKYYAIVFGCGFFLSFIFPSFMADHGIAKPIAFGCVYVALNLHHFVTDMFIWKLRDPVVQKLLVA